MKTRAGKREGAARKKSPALTKITRNQSKTLESKPPLYIFGKSHFLNLAKGSCGGNVRKQFELRVMAWSLDEDKLRDTVDYLLDKDNL